jgi:hypothetical protein
VTPSRGHHISPALTTQGPPGAARISEDPAKFDKKAACGGLFVINGSSDPGRQRGRGERGGGDAALHLSPSPQRKPAQIYKGVLRSAKKEVQTMDELRETITAIDAAIEYLRSAIDDLMTARFLVQNEAKSGGKVEKGGGNDGKTAH